LIEDYLDVLYRDLTWQEIEWGTETL